MGKIFAAVVILAYHGLLQAQPVVIEGKWEFQVISQFRTDHIMLDFRTDGGVLDGTITRSDPPGQKPEKLEGVIDKDVVTFTVKSPDGLRTITMQGKISGNEIHFTRTATGVQGRGPGDSFYGLNGPDTIVAIRVRNE